MAQDDGAKSSRELEHEVEQQRSAVEQTLTELVERFSPAHLLRSLLGQDSSGSNDAPQQPRQLLDLLSANPVPTLLAAAGLGWLMMSQTRQEEHHSRPAPARDEPSHASYGVDPDYDPHSGEGHVALEKDERKDREEDLGRSMAYEDNLGNQVNSILRSQPLLVAAFGIALGGLLGAALPRLSRQEVSFSERLEEYNEHSAHLPSERDDVLNEGDSSPEFPTRH